MQIHNKGVRFMEENVIVTSKNKKGNFLLILSICFLVIAGISFSVHSVTYPEAKEKVEQYQRAQDANRSLYTLGYKFSVSPEKWSQQHKDAYTTSNNNLKRAKAFKTVAYISVVLCLISAFIWFLFGRTNVSVTNARVYGRALFGKQVDIPLQNIVTLQTGNPKSITLTTEAGKTTFIAVPNRDEIYTTMQSLTSKNEA